MNQVFYLETDEEITSVVDKIRNAETNGVVLVMPRGGTLAQSIVNLKLLKRSSGEFGKEIFIVSSDSISKNLADRLKIKVFSNVKEAEKAKIEVGLEEVAEPEVDQKESNYKKYDLSSLNKRKEQNKNLYEDVIEEEEEGDQSQESADLKSNEEISVGLENTAPNYDNNDSDNMDKQDNLDAESEQQVANSSRQVPETNREDVGFKTTKISVTKIEPEEKVDNPIKEPKNPSQIKSRRILIFALVFVLLLALGLSAVVLPSVNVTLALKTNDYVKNFDLTVDRNIKESDISKMILAGQLETVEQDVTKKIDATGQKNVGEKATGTVTISNSFDFQKSVVIDKGAVISREGKSFVIQKSVFVPKAVATIEIQNGKPTIKTTPGTIDVPVTAVDPGEQFNIPAGKFTFTAFTGEKKDQITATSTAAFTGGTDKQVKYVTDADLKGAETSVKQSAFDQVKFGLVEASKKDNLKVLDKYITSEVVSVSPAAKENDQVDNFDYTMKVKAYAIGFSEAKIRDLAVESVNTNINADEMIVNPEKAMVTYEVSDSDVDKGTLKIKAEFTGKIGKKVAVSQIQDALKLKNKASATAYLNRIDGVTSSDLKINPSFWIMTPILKSKINVTFGYN